MARKAGGSAARGPTYKPGHIVYLRSGGPEMVIESIETNGDLNCVWFPTGGENWELPCRYRFPKPSVQLAIDGDLVDSERGRFVAADGTVPEHDENDASVRKLDATRRRKPSSREKL